MTRFSRRTIRAALFTLLTLAGTRAAFAQVTPAAGYTPPDDSQSVKVGATIFTDYTFTNQPTTTDVDGNVIRANAFSSAMRAYINITGNISHLVSFRITPDVSRETGAGSSLSGSYTYRIKYTFLQVNLDDWMSKGSWTRLGIQQTPWVDFEENIYRYRFQGTVFSEREGLLSSSDAGASVHVNFKDNFGDVHVGIYNGETYTKAETNNQKALQARLTFRPFAKGDANLRGLRVHGFYDADNYAKGDERKRAQVSATFEHARANAGFDYVIARDQTSAAATLVQAHGFSAWVTPFFKEKGNGLEALLRYDHYTPNLAAATSNQARQRTIAGLSYWFPHPGGSATAAILFDYEQVVFANFAVSSSTAKQQRLAVHGLINF